MSVKSHLLDIKARMHLLDVASGFQRQRMHLLESAAGSQCPWLLAC